MSSNMQVPVYMQKYIQSVILETEKKLLQVKFDLPEVLPKTIDETHKLLDMIWDKKYLLSCDSYKEMREVTDSILNDLNKADILLMKHLESLELPLHSSWLDDLVKIKRYIYDDDDDDIPMIRVPDDYLTNHSWLDFNSSNIRATILPTHPCYKLAFTSDGEHDMEVVKSFIEESYDLAVAKQGKDKAIKLLIDLLHTGFDSYYASKKMKKLLDLIDLK